MRLHRSGSRGGLPGLDGLVVGLARTMITAATTMDGTAESTEGGSTSEPDNQPEPEPEPAASRRPHAREAEVIISCAPGVGNALRTREIEWLRDHVGRTLDHLQSPVRGVRVRVVDEPTMRELHLRHLGCDEPTDVLTFSHAGAGEPVEADVAVCMDVAARCAAEAGHAVERELLLYALHGILHCAGYEDKSAEGFSAIHAEEDRILAAIGVGPVFGGTQS